MLPGRETRGGGTLCVMGEEGVAATRSVCARSGTLASHHPVTVVPSYPVFYMAASRYTGVVLLSRTAKSGTMNPATMPATKVLPWQSARCREVMVRRQRHDKFTEQEACSHWN